MSEPQSSKPRKRIYVIIGLVSILGILSYKAIFSWPAEVQVRERQADFLTAIEEGDYGRLDDLISAGYNDQWEFDKEAILAAIGDIRSQFFGLQIKWSAAGENFESDAASMKGELGFDGTGTPVSNMILNRASRVEGPFTFHWIKEGILPWEWKLTRVEHADLEVPSRYTPGQLRKRTF